MKFDDKKVYIIDNTTVNGLKMNSLMNEYFPELKLIETATNDDFLFISKKEKPDLIMVSSEILIESEFKICHQLKSQVETKHIPIVIILNTPTDSAFGNKALDCGADVFLRIPCEAFEFQAQIKTLLLLSSANESVEAEDIVENQKVYKGNELQFAAISLEEVLLSQVHFGRIFEQAPIGMFSYDVKGIVTGSNHFFNRMRGDEEHDILGTDLHQVKNPKMLKAIKLSLQGKLTHFDGEYTTFSTAKSLFIKASFAPVVALDGIVKGGICLIDDATELHQSQKAQKEIEKRFEKIFYSSPIAISITQFHSGNFLDVNDAYCHLTGYNREDLIGKNILELGIISEESRNSILAAFTNSDDSQDIEVTLQRQKKEKRNINVTVERFMIGNETLLLSNFIDITDRKHFGTEITKLTRAVEQSPVSIIITNLDGTIEYVNPKACQVSGYYPNELIGKNPRLFKSGKTSKEEYQEMYATILRGEIWQNEFQNVKKNGDLYWERVTMGPVINEDGLITNFLAVKEDITEQKAMEEELVKSETLYRSIFTENPIPMWIYDEHSLRFLEVNDAAVIQYGYSYNEFHKMTTSDLRSPFKGLELTAKDVQDSSSGIKSMACKHIIKDGSIIEVELTSHDLPPQKGIRKRIVMAYNVTDKKAEQLALQKAKALAEASDRLKTAFLNNISHEVRTPLNGIMGAAMLLNEPGLEQDEIPSLIEIINLSTQRLIQTVTDYMDISLLTSGNIELNVREHTLNEITEPLIKKIEEGCKAKNLEFVVDISNEVSAQPINTDSELLSKALNHLLSNAVKFTKSGKVWFSCSRNQHDIVFEVKDTGVGIEPKMQEKIFENFTQEDMGNSRKFEGSGLGLSIVSRVTDKLKGKIAMSSKKDEGTTITLHIPDYPSHSHVGKDIHPQPDKLVLIAEDEDSNFIVLDMILRKTFKANVLRAKNGFEAVDLAKEHSNLSLIIMDIKMPEMDGLEATRLIKSFNKNVPIIAVTAFAMSGDEHKAIEAGCDAYLPKPISRNDLYSKLELYGFKA